MSMWPHHPRGPRARGPRARRGELTQLYNDTKSNFATAFGNRNTPTSVFDDNDPEVVALRKDFQEQQDRLLAWGMHWQDKQTSSSTKGKMAGSDIYIDETVDQAGQGELVASIMESIKNTLSQSGRLQHPDRYKDNHTPAPTTGWGPFRAAGVKEKSADRSQDYRQYELTTGRELLKKLQDSIDLLYTLDNDTEQSNSKALEAKAERDQRHDPAELLARSPPTHTLGLDQVKHTTRQDSVARQLLNHPLYIDFSRLEPMHDANAAAEPPSYEEAKENTSPLQAKSIYFCADMQTHVLLDLARAESYPVVSRIMDETDPLRQTEQLSQLVSGKGLLTWDGHLKMLGFTIAHGNSRFGLVYALPRPNDPTALQACQTLTTSINATLEHENAIPPLETKFRLAYNIALNVTSYLAHGHCHGHIKSSSIVFLRENDNPKLGKALRCPYILQPVQALVGEPKGPQPIRETIYHHSGTEEAGYGVVAAYDIFSVGMILLEIGLWRNLTSFWKPKYDLATFHDRLARYYVPKLASKCGSRYMNLVKRCFEAPDILQDKPSPMDAADHLLEVVDDLCRCCALDETGPPSELDIEVYESLVQSYKLAAPQASKSNSAQPPLHETQTRPPMSKKSSTTSKKTKQKPAEALKKWPNLDIPQDHLETWNKMLMPRLSKMLANALKDSMESCSVSLMMIGSTPEKAKTTICVQCPDTARVKETLCSRFKPKSGWGLIVCAGDVRRSGQIPRRNTKSSYNARRSGVTGSIINEEKTREQMYQAWPGNGASIGAWTNEHHLPPVSFGGTVIVDGQPYGMTVHHMLDDGETDDTQGTDAPTRSAAQTMTSHNDLRKELHDSKADFTLRDVLDDLDLIDDNERVETSDEDELSDTESDTSTIRPDYMIMDEDSDDFFFADDDDLDDMIPDLDDDDGGEGNSSDESDIEDDTGSVGDKKGLCVDRFDDEDFCITQPAFDDVPENWFGDDDPEFRDEEHLLSHSFGYVHASSGLRRITKLNMKHEVDWALIKIKDNRLNLAVNPEAAGLTSRKSSKSSKIRKNSKQGAAFVEPALTKVTPITSLPKMVVNCVGRTSGKTSGRISQALSLLKLPGRQSFSASFTVEGGMGVPGDSGAWVYSEDTKELCGHILAFSETLNMAYIVPMEILFDDLKTRLKAQEVRLPAQASTFVSPYLTYMQAQKTTTYGKTYGSQIEEEPQQGQLSAVLSAKIQSLHIDTSPSIAQVKNRRESHASSDGGHYSVSPVSAASGAAQRSRADHLQRTTSPRQIQLPTPPATAESERGPSTRDVKAIYEYGSSDSKSVTVNVGKECASVTRPIPS